MASLDFRRPCQGSCACYPRSGGLHHRLISNVPPGQARNFIARTNLSVVSILATGAVALQTGCLVQTPRHSEAATAVVGQAHRLPSFSRVYWVRFDFTLP